MYVNVGWMVDVYEYYRCIAIILHHLVRPHTVHCPLNVCKITQADEMEQNLVAIST